MEFMIPGLCNFLPCLQQSTRLCDLGVDLDSDGKIKTFGFVRACALREDTFNLTNTASTQKKKSLYIKAPEMSTIKGGSIEWMSIRIFLS